MDDFLALLSLDFQLAVDIAFQMLPLLFHYRFISNGWDFPHALTALWVSSGCGFLNVVPNLVSLTRPSLQILSKTQMVVFLISGCQVNPLFHNYHNSRTSNDIRMKLGQVTKLDKRNKATSKKKKKKKKNWRRRQFGKFWHHSHFYNLWPIWSIPEVGFQMLSHFH